MELVPITNMPPPGKELEAMTPCGGIWTLSRKQWGATEHLREVGRGRCKRAGGESQQGRRTGDWSLEGHPTAAARPFPGPRCLGPGSIGPTILPFAFECGFSEGKAQLLTPLNLRFSLHLHPWEEMPLSSEVDKREEKVLKERG